MVVSLTLTVLGSSAMYATTDRAASGYLLDIDGMKIWMDAGGGTWRHILEHLEYPDIDGVILSHRHPDHVIDVFQLFHARRYGGDEPLPLIPLWAPDETIQRVKGFSHEIDEAFDLIAVAEGDKVAVGNATVEFFRMAHPPVTLGLRLEVGETVFAYSADGGPSADFEPIATNADMFLCEATFQEGDEEWEGHMRASEAGEIADRCGAKHLLLTHLPADRDLGLSIAQAEKTSGAAKVQLAADGLQIEVGE